MISLRGHVPGPPGTLAASDLSVAGPLARSADDLGMLLDILAAPNDQEGMARQLKLPPSRHEKLQDFRVALWLDEPNYPIDGSVRSALESTANALRKAGLHVDDKPT